MDKGKMLLLIYLLVSMTLMSTSCRKGPDLRDPNVRKKILTNAGKHMQITFPVSTRLLNFGEDAGQDYTTYLKIQIDKRDVQSFIDNSPIAGEELRNDRRFVGDVGEEWWASNAKAVNYRSGFAFRPSLRILIDLDEPNKAIIYMECTGAPVLYEDSPSEG